MERYQGFVRSMRSLYLCRRHFRPPVVMSGRWILQFCHGYSGPFADVTRQYAALFRGSPYKVLTVYLTGAPSKDVVLRAESDEVAFLGYSAREVAGLKLGAIHALRRLLVGRDIALVIAHRAKPIYVACLATRLPVIGVHHAFGDYKRASRRCFANVFRRRLALLAVSDAVRDDIRRCLPAWPQDRIETLHNRLDVEAARRALLPRAEARLRLGLPEGVPVIGTVGRLHPDKDQATLVAGFAAALPALPAGTLLAIAGSGPLEGKLKAQAEALGIAPSVRFLGQIPEARRCFKAFDLFVLSSDHEPFGMVLLEAMAADVPVMATACGGAPEVVDDPACLFPLGDSRALAGMLIRFFAAPVAGTHGPTLEEKFSDHAARTRFFALPLVREVLSC